MSRDPDFHAALIRRLGGKTRLCGALGLDRDTVTKWHTRGIPSRYWHRIIDLAQAAGLHDVTGERLEATKPATRSQEAA